MTKQRHKHNCYLLALKHFSLKYLKHSVTLFLNEPASHLSTAFAHFHYQVFGLETSVILWLNLQAWFQLSHNYHQALQAGTCEAKFKSERTECVCRKTIYLTEFIIIYMLEVRRKQSFSFTSMVKVNDVAKWTILIIGRFWKCWCLKIHFLHASENHKALSSQKMLID